MFCQQNRPERDQVQDWYRNGEMVVVSRRRRRSLSLLAFRRNVVNSIFLKYSKERRLPSSHVGIRNIPSDVCYDDTKQYQKQSEHKRIQNLFKHLRLSVFALTMNGFHWLTDYAKTPHLRFEEVRNTPLLKNKGGVRCTNRTLDAAR